MAYKADNPDGMEFHITALRRTWGDVRVLAENWDQMYLAKAGVGALVSHYKIQFSLSGTSW